jgi:phosphoglycolate phosphatase-like HAD superfamily hydrolase
MSSDMRIGIDLDGTILDSKKRHVQALILAAERENVILPSKLIESFVNEKSSGYTGLEVLKKYKVPNKDKIINNWIQLIETESLLSLDNLYPNVEKLLCKYTSIGMKFYLVTKRKNVEGTINQIKSLGINKYFEAVHIVNPNFELNTHSSSLKAKCTEEYNLDCVIGDTEDDYEWAKVLNIKFYALSYGFRNEYFWAKNNIKCYSDLSDVFYAIEKEIILGNYQYRF